MYRCDLCGAMNPRHGASCRKSSEYEFSEPVKPSLADRVDARVRAEWPGTQIPLRASFVPDGIRQGGGTDTLLRLVKRIVAEESKR